MVLNVRNVRVLATVSLLLVATRGQKSYWSNFREVDDDGQQNGESESNGWAIAHRPGSESEQNRGPESQQDEEPETWTTGPGEGESEMNAENGWSNGQERYLVQQGQEDEKDWINQPRGQTSTDEEKMWVRSRGQPTQLDEEKVWASSRGQHGQNEEKVWVNRPTRVPQQGSDEEEEKVWVKRPTKIQQGPEDEGRVWVSNKPSNSGGQQAGEKKVWVRDQPNQEENNYERERFYVQQPDDSNGPTSQEKPKDEIPVYNDGPNTERHRYIVTQQPQTQDEESERPSVTYVTKNQWAASQQQQSEDEIALKLQQERAKEQIYANQQRPTQQQEWQQPRRSQQEDNSNQPQPEEFVYKTKPTKPENSGRQTKSRRIYDSNVANPNNWPRARQMETYNANEDNAELRKKERILQLLQELQRLQLESLRDSTSSSNKRGSKGNAQQQQFAESVHQYWSDNQNQNQHELGSQNRPFQYRYGEDQAIPWSRLPRLTSKSDATPEIKKLAKVLAKEIINKQKETAGRHNHLHSRALQTDYYSKLKYGQARGNKQGGVTITWSEPWSNLQSQNSARPSYDAAQSLYKSAGSAPAWTATQLNKMYSASRYETSKKKTKNPEVNVVEIAIPLVNGGSINDHAKSGGKGNAMLNALTNGGQINYGGLAPAMGRALIENSMAKLVEQYVKDTAAAVVADAVKKDQSTKRLMPVLISLDKRLDRNENGTELIHV